MIVCDVCGHVNPDGTQYCENCGVELKAAAKPSSAATQPSSAATPAQAAQVPTSSEPSTAHPSGEAPATAQTLENARQAEGQVGGTVHAMVEQPILEAAPAPGEGTVINNPETHAAHDTPATEAHPSASAPTSSTPSDATVSTPVLTPPHEDAVEEAAATGTVSSVHSESVHSEPVSSQAVPAQDVEKSAQPTSQGGEVHDAPVSSQTLTQAQPSSASDASSGATQVNEQPHPVSSAPSAAPASTSGTPAQPSGSPSAAKLGIKKFGALTGDTIPLLGTHLTVGRFDPSTGPVEIDVSSLPGAEHISRRHAELYWEGGHWMVRDLGSTNGVFVKKARESAFSPRLQAPVALFDGDEIAFGNMILTFMAG